MLGIFRKKKPDETHLGAPPSPFIVTAPKPSGEKPKPPAPAGVPSPTQKPPAPSIAQPPPQVSRLKQILQFKSQPRPPGKAWPKFFIAPHEITPLEPGVKEATYPLIRPYAYASIKEDPKEGDLVYTVVEPVLNDTEKKILAKLKQGLVQAIDVPMSAVKNSEALLAVVEQKVQRLIEVYRLKVSDDSYLRMMYYLYRDFVGLNEIEPLLRDPFIEDMTCDGTNIPIYVIHQRFGSIRTNVIFPEPDRLRDFVVKLAERCDRYISYAEPLLDGSLPDGTRVQSSLAGDVTAHGPTFSIRKFPMKPFTPIDMLGFKTASPEILAYMWYIVENGANVIICGGTATGKTSFLNTISFFIPPESKIVSIEDTRELNLFHENWTPSVARMGFAGTRVGEVTMYDLLRAAFRQNPAYLIVGEVRGEETAVMFQGMASGITCMSTMHAGSIESALKRLQTRPISLPPVLMETLDAMIIMSHVPEKGKSARRVREIVEIISVDAETSRVKSHEIASWNPAQDSFTLKKTSYLLQQIAEEHGITVAQAWADIAERAKVIKWLSTQKMDWKDIAKHFTLFYRNRDSLMEIVEKEKPKSKRK